VDEAGAAHAAGADAVIVQGVEAGGHVRGGRPALELLDRVRAALPRDYPVLLAGGVADRSDVERALEAGAAAAVAGTRFLLSEESRAHPDYKRRLLKSEKTVLTELFGAGWPARHRVVPNAAIERWLRKGPEAPPLHRLVNRAMAPAARFTPAALQRRMAAAQSPAGRVLLPVPPTDDGPANLVEAGPLYAGETVARIRQVQPAATIVRSLVP
jgi:NAD(P)H-dependent flavin oxidoreductase YrpB (nitropropane dioxygenase family)